MSVDKNLGPPLKKVKDDAERATSVPPPCCASARELEVFTVTPAPAVIVQVPAPLFAMKIVSPVVKIELFTVIVVAPALFMMTRFPASPTTRT
jgi:hypothetical protein